MNSAVSLSNTSTFSPAFNASIAVSTSDALYVVLTLTFPSFPVTFTPYADEKVFALPFISAAIFFPTKSFPVVACP